MMTRAGVAKRLGKSIATVRRMEGVELHPMVDSRGVHRFNPNEVEQVARADTLPGRRPHRIADLQAHKQATGLPFAEEPWADESSGEPLEGGEDYLAQARAEYAALRQEYAALREKQLGPLLRQEAERRAAEEQKRREKSEAEQAEKEAVAADILAMLESASDRELAAIGSDALEELVELLEADED